MSERTERVRANRWQAVGHLALMAWAVIASVAFFALVVQASHDRKALRTSQRAVVRVEAEATGLCGAVNANRSYVNGAHTSIRKVFLDVAQLQFAQARQLSHGISRGVRAAAKTSLALGRELRDAGNAIQAVDLLDCAALTKHPLQYALPQPHPFR